MNHPPFPGERFLRQHWGAAKGVKACPALSDWLKVLWVELYGLHTSLDGAYMGAGPLAARLGRSREAVEEGRRTLKALGLLHDVRSAEKRRRTSSWYALVPAEFLPATKEEPDSVSIALATQLAAYVESRRRKPESNGVRAHAIPEAARGRMACEGTPMNGVPVPSAADSNGVPGTTPATPNGVPRPTSPGSNGVRGHAPEFKALEVGNNLKAQELASATEPSRELGGSGEPGEQGERHDWRATMRQAEADKRAEMEARRPPAPGEFEAAVTLATSRGIA